MKKISTQIITLLGLTILLIGCSTRKDRFINRAMHGTATKYNVMYNGRVAYDAAKKQLDDNYKDDFFKTLPIEPLKIKSVIELPPGPKSKPTTDNTSSTGSFSKAEEKAVKAIQKHSMNIGGRERNKQIDDAYFLLGKARYYDQRFVPAIETFKYIIKHYPDSPLFSEARIWEAKCLTRLGIEDEAIYKLDLLLELKETSDQVKANALTALAMAYTEQDSTQMVINLLDSTLLYHNKKHNQKARNLFILGQLYRQENKIDSSNIIFDKLANFKKAPYRFKIYSQLERAKNYNKENDSTALILKNLTKLSKNRDNRPFLDAIYYQLGKINLTNNSDNVATDYFNKALRTKAIHTDIQSLAFEDLGNIKFNKADFLNAGSYYDSVLSVTENKNNKRIRRLIRKRKSLDEVIRLENISSKNDSILSLASMSTEAQTTLFKKHIKQLKEKEEEANTIADNKNSSGFGSALINPSSKQSNKGGKFYFYNAQTIGFGKIEFAKIWGKRDLVDNWRSTTKSSQIDTNQNNSDSTEDSETIDESQKYDVDYYLSRIPTDKSILDSLSNQRNNAYYNLGLIYKEKFKKDKLATNRLESLLGFKPKDKMILPIYYHLYKAYQSFDMQKSDFYKSKITSDYGDSRYAKIITNPEMASDTESDANSPENNYKNTYKQYLNEEYVKVLSNCEKFINDSSNTDIIPKFELLKAYAIAKTKGKDDFIQALTYVATNYPNLEEGIHAAKVIASLKGETIPEKTTPKTDKIKKAKSNKMESKKEIRKINKDKSLPSNERMLELINNKRKNLGPPGSNKK